MNPAPSHRVGGRLQEPPPAAVQVPPVAPAAPTAPEIVEAPVGAMWVVHERGENL